MMQFMPGKFSSLGDKLNEKLKKVFEASSDKSDVNEPKIFKGKISLMIFFLNLLYFCHLH